MNTSKVQGDKMYYIGLDLAWTYKNPSGLCIINEDKEIVFLKALLGDDQQLANIINKYTPSIISVDAPLIVNNEVGSRQCDRLLMKHSFHGNYLKLLATSRSYMLRTYGCIRGESLVEYLDNHVIHKNILETFPTGIFLVLFPNLYKNKYKLSSRLSLDVLKSNATNLIDEIKTMGFKTNLSCIDIMTKKSYKSFEDKLDGILCALNRFYSDDCQRFEVDENGCIVLPRYI